jgi:hypothetical protein
MILLTASLGGASWSLICLIIALVLLFIAAFVQPSMTGPSWTRVNLFAAGMFFYVLAVAVS